MHEFTPLIIGLGCILVSIIQPVYGADVPDRLLNRSHTGVVSLSGKWEFKLDPQSIGEKDRWYDGNIPFSERIQVPGCWDAQGKGIPGLITTVANADDTQPHVRTVSAYNGDAWYGRDFQISKNWQGKVIWLNIGGVNDRANVWVNGRPAGGHDGYCTGFKIDITNLVKINATNRCVIRVSNAPRGEGNLEGCFDFYTNWGGIYRDVWLEATDKVWIDHIQVIPELAKSSARIRLKIMGKQDVTEDVQVRLILLSSGGRKVLSSCDEKTRVSSGTATFELSIPISKPKLWSPESPYLYSLRAQILIAGKVVDSTLERFGMREIRVEGKHFLLNGKPIFLRGYGTDGIYPQTVSPPPSKSQYIKELRRAKTYGFNFARQHTWIPLPEHLDAADEVGILMQIEMPTGLHPISHPSAYLEKLWRDELTRTIETNIDHPSWVILSMGNELGDALNDPAVMKTYSGLTKMARDLDPSRLVIITSGSTTPLPPEEPFYSRGIYGIQPVKTSSEGVSGWIAGHDRPYIWHEMGYYASYPDTRLRRKYTGGAIPFWLDEAARVAKEKGFIDELPTYIRNSVRLQQVCRKWHLEFARKISELAGFEWWTFKDNSWPIEGIVDDFTDPKEGVSPESIRRLNVESVLLLEQEPRTAHAGDVLKLKAEISHYSSQPFKNAVLKWELRSGETSVMRGEVSDLDVDQYGLSNLATIAVPLPALKSPVKYLLHLELSSRLKKIENEWPVWVFPEAKGIPAGTGVYDPSGSLTVMPFPVHRLALLSEAKDSTVLVSTALSEDVISYAEHGGKVLLISRKRLTGLPEFTCAEESPDIPYPLYFAPTYWGAPYAPGGGNLGTVVADHAALGSFPHEGFCDLQFLHLLYGVDRADLDALPVHINPIIRSITDWRLGANAAYMYEVKVGDGAFLVTTLNFEQALADKCPEAGWLLSEMLSYCVSDAFHPKTELAPDFLRKSSPPKAPFPNISEK